MNEIHISLWPDIKNGIRKYSQPRPIKVILYSKDPSFKLMEIKGVNNTNDIAHANEFEISLINKDKCIWVTTKMQLIEDTYYLCIDDVRCKPFITNNTHPDLNCNTLIDFIKYAPET